MCIIKANLLTYDRRTNTHLKLHHMFPLYGDIERGKRIYTFIENLMKGVEENNRESQKPTIALPSHVANSLVSLTRVWSSFKEAKNTWHHKYEIGDKPYKRIGNAHFIRLLINFPIF